MYGIGQVEYDEQSREKHDSYALMTIGMGFVFMVMLPPLAMWIQLVGASVMALLGVNLIHAIWKEQDSRYERELRGSHQRPHSSDGGRDNGGMAGSGASS